MIVQAAIATEMDDDAMEVEAVMVLHSRPDTATCTICQGQHQLVLCRGGRISDEAGSHIICERCCTTWFAAQRELRAAAMVANLRPECPVCKCALRSCSSRGDASRFMGLEKIADGEELAPESTEFFTFGDVPSAAVRRCVALAIRSVLTRVAMPRAPSPHGTAGCVSSACPAPMGSRKRKHPPRSQRSDQCDGPQARAAALVAMGFTHLSAVRALVACDNDVQRAVELLIEQGADEGSPVEAEATSVAPAAVVKAEAAAQRAREAAAAEGLQLVVSSSNASGFKCVCLSANHRSFAKQV